MIVGNGVPGVNGCGTFESIPDFAGLQMPRFFIDTSDEAHFVRDRDGTEFEDLEAAVKAAVDGLPDMARDILPSNGDARLFLCLVRDTSDRLCARASLTFSIQRFVSRP